jgi:hypothetical protein
VIITYQDFPFLAGPAANVAPGGKEAENQALPGHCRYAR